MKKIALFFTIACAGQLYGMESQPIKFGEEWKNLPHEVIYLILQSGNNLDDAIKNIVKASAINKELNNELNDLKGFTKIVHMIADEFNSTTADVAKKFETPTSTTYLALVDKLRSAMLHNNVNEVAQVIEKGVDVNYNFKPFFNATGASLLARAVYLENIEIIKLLLDNGANPNLKDIFGKTVFEWAEECIPNDEGSKQLLESYKK